MSTNPKPAATAFRVLETSDPPLAKLEADKLRELADKIENDRDITGVVIVAVTTDDRILTHSRCTGRLQLMGALHMAMIEVND